MLIILILRSRFQNQPSPALELARVGKTSQALNVDQSLIEELAAAIGAFFWRSTAVRLARGGRELT
jgi:hypothetical protein